MMRNCFLFTKRQGPIHFPCLSFNIVGFPFETFIFYLLFLNAPLLITNTEFWRAMMETDTAKNQ